MFTYTPLNEQDLMRLLNVMIDKYEDHNSKQDLDIIEKLHYKLRTGASMYMVSEMYDEVQKMLDLERASQ